MFRLELDNDQKIIFFNLLNNLDESYNIDEAEQKVIDDIITAMESELAEPFSENYEAVLKKAKNNLLRNKNE